MNEKKKTNLQLLIGYLLLFFLCQTIMANCNDDYHALSDTRLSEENKAFVSNYSFNHQWPLIKTFDLSTGTFIEIPISDGSHITKALRGEVNGTKLFVKVLGRRRDESENYIKSQVLSEAKWYMALNSIGIGVQFKGVTRTATGDLALVTEYKKGTFISKFNKARLLFWRNKNKLALIDSLKKQVQTLSENGISAVDLQFIISPEGAFLIDPTGFTLGNPANAKKYNDEILEKILSNIK